MGNGKQEPAIAFAEVSRPVRPSCTQHSSPAFDGKFMVYCQGMKLFIPEDFQADPLLKLLRVMKQL